MIYNDVISLIGNTPLYKVKGYDEENRANVYVKLEKFNPGGSIKDRAALGMIEEAINDGKLKEGDVIVEPTSGNTGIALAMIGVSLGYRVIIVMPDSLSEERRGLIKAYGAELVLTDGNLGMTGAISEALKLKETLKEDVFIPQQFENRANPNKHYETTAKEIFDDIKDLDAFVCGVGTGGTITGFSRYAKKINSKAKIYALEPIDSPVISGGKAGKHKIQGIGAGFIPGNYDASLVDEVVKVSSEDAIKVTRDFSHQTGVLIGISSGANIHGALSVAKKLGPGKNVVTVAPDGGEKYISTKIFD
ncbi:MAG: cysteine synthase A [Clostridium sp.]|nr:cysteine synthase A [Clostridium sp.]